MKPLLTDFTQSQLLNLGTYLSNELDSAILMCEHRNSDKFTFVPSKYFNCVAQSQYIILERIVNLLESKNFTVPRSFTLALKHGESFNPFNMPIDELNSNF